MALVKEEYENGQSFTYDPETHVVVFDPNDSSRLILVRRGDKPVFSEPQDISPG